VRRMGRPKELLSLARIAEETGISYQTLRGYAIKYVAEIPAEGSGRNTRYPRAAVKVFQRLRRESRPGRKPAGHSEAAAVADSVPAVEERERSVAPQEAAVDTRGIERELAGIRVHLGSLAESLAELVSLRKSAEARAPVEAPAEPASPESPAAVPPSPPHAAENQVIPAAARGLREVEERGHRQLHSLSRVRGQRGRRPD
jgi:hypothetical protein